MKGKYEGEFNIYGHNEVVNILNTLSNMMLTKKLLKFVGNGINICEVCHGDKIDVIGMNIEFFDIESTKDKQFGFKAVLPNKKTLVLLLEMSHIRRFLKSMLKTAIGCFQKHFAYMLIEKYLSLMKKIIVHLLRQETLQRNLM